MRKLLSVFALLAGLGLQAEAFASATMCHTNTEPYTTCNNTEGHSRILHASDASMADIPFPVEIVSVTIANNASPPTAGQSGIWQLWLDPGSVFATANPGYPASQIGNPGLTILVDMDWGIGSRLHVTRDLVTPIPFDATDSLIIDMPCNNSAPSAPFNAQEWWSICWIKP